jgi:hypothetical protein
MFVSATPRAGAGAFDPGQIRFGNPPAGNGVAIVFDRRF